jgi:hypothetical protein
MADPIFSDPRLRSGIEEPGYSVLKTAEARYKRSLYVSLVGRLATGPRMNSTISVALCEPYSGGDQDVRCHV